MKYFKVEAKCGHVKRNKFTPKSFYIKAKNGKEAAKIARDCPRVKHHQKDAIQSVQKISLEEYLLGKKAMMNDLFFKIHNSSEQKRLYTTMDIEIYKEPEKTKYKTKRDGQNLRYRKLLKETDKILTGGFFDE